MNISTYHLIFSHLASGPMVNLATMKQGSTYTVKNSYFSRNFDTLFRFNSQKQDFFAINTKFELTLNSAVQENPYSSQKFTFTLNISYRSTIQIENCIFYGCIAKSSAGGGGLNIYKAKSKMIINDSSFIKCSALEPFANGGGILISESNGEIIIKSNCFDSCTAKNIGHAIEIKSKNTHAMINETCISNCPLYMYKQQQSVIQIVSTFSQESINCSNQMATQPFLNSRGSATVNMSYINVFNSTSSTSWGSIYEISTSNATLSYWNVIMCRGDYPDVAVYKGAQGFILHRGFVLADGSTTFWRFGGSHCVSFVECYADAKPLFRGSCQYTVDINIIESPKTNDIGTVYFPRCLRTIEAAGPLRLGSGSLAVPLAVAFVIFFGAIVVAALVGRISRHREMAYLALAVPEIVDE